MDILERIKEVLRAELVIPVPMGGKWHPSEERVQEVASRILAALPEDQGEREDALCKALNPLMVVEELCQWPPAPCSSDTK
jgi:hypothetical protein